MNITLEVIIKRTFSFGHYILCNYWLYFKDFMLLFIFIPSFYRIRTAFFSFLFSILGSINSILSLFYIILIGIVIINSSYFRYYDLKKIIALSLILHLNLTFHAMLSLNSSGIYCAIVIPFQYHLLIL